MEAVSASKKSSTELETPMSATLLSPYSDLLWQEASDDPRPMSQPPQSPTYSGSDYSDYQSMTGSRRTSSRPQSNPYALEDVSLADEPQLLRHSGSDYGETQESRESMPNSTHGEDIVEAVEVAEEVEGVEGVEGVEEVEEAAPQSPMDSDSEYSEPQTPNRLRPASMHSRALHNHIEKHLVDEEPVPQAAVELDLNQRPRVQQTTTVEPLAESYPPVTLTPAPQPVRWHKRTSSLQPPPPTIPTAVLPVLPEVLDYADYVPATPESPGLTEGPLSPLTPSEARMSMDSLQSIALSETGLNFDDMSEEHVKSALATPRLSEQQHLRKASSLEILQGTWRPPFRRQSTFFDNTKDQPLESPGPEEDTSIDSTSAWKSESTSSVPRLKRASDSSLDGTEVDWNALDKTEEQEKEDRDLPEGVEDESTAFLLARLEQENAKFTADPKSTAGVTINKQVSRVRSRSRPPSMAHLRRLVSRRDTTSTRYSLTPDVQEELLEEPPPMTELEFWAALVQDYPSTASRLPTLTTTKIRAGIPPPLRGVVWTSMSGAREKSLEEAFERLQNEESPYEGVINKDVGRSFPGVELFRDAEGEGQKMLARVLKCFSLYDKDIGYCQGMGFLVGPLLMNMGEKDAFCVLVRLMDHYALRASFLPSLSGLHMRIFQFSNLLAQHQPQLFEHLANIGIEPAYLSQWFLSCFAVTCPLPMLFRIYDVIFAEGANETVMRVALALFRRNEAKMMGSTEFEDVMQLLLGRALWDVYGCNADELVDDFTSLGNIITYQRLAELEADFNSKDGESVGESAGFLPDVQAAASRFLGRLWAPTHTHTPSKGAATTLSPQSAEKDSPGGSFLTRSSFMRRSASRNDIPLITDSSSNEESTSSGSASMASTAPTDAEAHDAATAESQADSMSMKSKPGSLRTVSISASTHLHMPATPGRQEQQELHTQIEDLLMALSEMQREHAQLAAMLQKEREERNDDHRVVRQLVDKIRKPVIEESGAKVRRSMPPPPRSMMQEVPETSVAEKRRTLPARPRLEIRQSYLPLDTKEKETNKGEAGDEIAGLVSQVQSRLETNARFFGSLETKAQLRTTLARTREQLMTAETQVKTLSERADSAETGLVTFRAENESLRAEVEELRIRVNDDFKEKQKLELTIQNMQIQMRMEAKALEKKQRSGWMARAESSGEVPTLSKLETQSRSRNGSVSSAPGSSGGLRELKLARRDSVGSVQSIRSMRSQRQTSGQWPQSPPPVVNISQSPTSEAAYEVAPAALPTPLPVVQPVAPSHTPTASASSLSVPASSRSVGFAARTSSLATQAVIATPAHEPVPDEALLLELVNAKTAEAQARLEVDELKKSLQIQRRHAEEALLQLQAQAASAQVEAEVAKAEAEQAREEAREARAEVFDASPFPTPFTPGVNFASTPIGMDDGHQKSLPPVPVPAAGSPLEKPEPKKGETAPASNAGGWFWSRRTASTTKATLDDN